MQNGRYKTVGALIDALSKYDRNCALRVKDVGGVPLVEIYGIVGEAIITDALYDMLQITGNNPLIGSTTAEQMKSGKPRTMNGLCL